MRQTLSILTGLCWLCISATVVAEGGNAGQTSAGLVQQKPATGRFVKTERGYMVPYTATIPGTEVSFEMVPIPSGTFSLGSPDAETYRKADEGPQLTVQLAPFWMGKHEVTWGEYQQYMTMDQAFANLDSLRRLLEGPFPIELKGRSPDDIARILESAERRHAHHDALSKIIARDQFAELREHLSRPIDMIDGVTAPTPLYDPTYHMPHGKNARLPVATITPFAARQYTKWLSGISGCVYRLPSEAEWEYACRSSSKTAFSFGGDAAKLREYAWYAANADERAHPVGTKKPNQWGLYDMHGNVAEWVLDEYVKDRYRKLGDKKKLAAEDMIAWPTKVSPRVIRGGSWDDVASTCRSAARNGTHDEEGWKSEDADLPQSPWWFTDSQTLCVGFRIVRPLEPPSKKLLAQYWDAQVESVKLDVEDRMDEGRGKLGRADKDLPTIIKQAEKLKKRGFE